VAIVSMKDVCLRSRSALAERSVAGVICLQRLTVCEEGMTFAVERGGGIENATIRCSLIRWELSTPPLQTIVVTEGKQSVQ
jgi:hypothetical protein